MLHPIAALALAVVAAPAGVLADAVYHSRAEWEAAIPSFVTEDFESYPLQSTSAGSLTFAAFDFVVPFNHEPIGTCWTTGPGSCGPVEPPGGGNIVLTGDVHYDPDGSHNELRFHDPILWFGIDFLWVEDAELDSFVVIESGGLFEETIDHYPSFFGFVSSTPFTSVVIHGPRVYYTVDDVSYSAPVPEPGSGLLLAAGLVGLGGRRRRHPRRRPTILQRLPRATAFASTM